MGEYVFDTMALTVLAQCLGAFSDAAWRLMCVIPAFVAYKGAVFVYGKWFGALGASAAKAAEPEEEPAPGKKEKKPKVKKMKGR